MRKFTKEHNDLNWLFPSVTDSTGGEDWFDLYENIGIDLLLEAHGSKPNNKSYTADDLIDAFMKGASEAHQRIYSETIENFQAIKYENKQIKTQNKEELRLLKEIKTLLENNN